MTPAATHTAPQSAPQPAQAGTDHPGPSVAPRPALRDRICAALGSGTVIDALERVIDQEVAERLAAATRGEV